MITAHKAHTIFLQGGAFASEVSAMLKRGEVQKIYKGDLDGKKLNKKFVEWITSNNLITTDEKVKKVAGVRGTSSNYEGEARKVPGLAVKIDQFKALHKEINEALVAAKAPYRLFRYFHNEEKSGTADAAPAPAPAGGVAAGTAAPGAVPPKK